MTEPSNGLRFDIYERVHLPDDVAAIEELEEIELVPHMQAHAEDDHVMLRGHLLLSGVYRAQETESGKVSQLEHWIPVEISLPSDRVERVEDLAVEIDNFDVDLLSARSLNVTGVLALRGLQVEAPSVPVWREDSFTVVHQAPLEPEPPAAVDPGDMENREFTEEAAAPRDSVWPGITESVNTPVFPGSVPYLAYPAGRETGLWPYPPAKPEVLPAAWTAAPESPPNPPPDAPHTRQKEVMGEADSIWGQDAMPPADQEDDRSQGWEEPEWGDLSPRRPPVEPELQPEPDLWPEPALSDHVPVQEDKPEMKVALSGKPLEPPASPSSGVGLLSQLGEKGAVREAELQALRSAQSAAEEAESKASRTTTGDELEWTKLFLGAGTEGHSFRKVKMCIVQREETLDTIAARYNVQPREIQLRNRLSDPYLSEGQVLYIP